MLQVAENRMHFQNMMSSTQKFLAENENYEKIFSHIGNSDVSFTEVMADPDVFI